MTLPIGWVAFENVEGRYLFEQTEPELTMWTHLDPDVMASSYELPLGQSNPSFYPKYEALSYTWVRHRTLRLCRWSRRTAIPYLQYLRYNKNLASAFKHLRYLDQPRRFWVDAVCINQKDISERNIQVTRMASIYKLAYSVVVWLGPESNDSKLALSTLDLHCCTN